MFTRAIFYIYLICLTIPLFGQLPTTNIYTLNLRANEQKVLLDAPTLLTNFNFNGYNNQPFFINDNELFITSNFECYGLTDILKLNLSEKSITRITKTEESEYSPTLMKDKEHFSVVRQELDDSQPVPQVLWSYPLDLSTVGNLIIPDLQNIGYHAWVTSDKVALFLVGNPSELIVYDLARGTKTHIANNVGRAIKTDKLGNIFYTKIEEDKRTIYSFDIYLGRSKKVTTLPGSQQDFDILQNGFFITGNGSKIMTFNPLYDRNWTEVIDLKGASIKNITRIASAFNKIAIVAS